MKITKLFLVTFAIGIILVSCKKDDEFTTQFIERDRQEVYNENRVDIEAFLESHTFNYAEFQENLAYSDLSTSPPTITPNDSYKIEFTELTETSTDLSIMSFLNSATYPKLEIDTVYQDGVDYELYILKVREGLGDDVHRLDKASVLYKGSLPDGTIFDSAVTVNTSFNLTAVGAQAGVITGFREGLVKFKASEGFTDNASGETVYHNHGIGAVFVPSGLGYFSSTVNEIPSYSPVFFRFRVITRSNTDFDLDGVPSHLEDLEGDGYGFSDDTDGDGLPNFIDNDDDGDGVLTRYEDINEDGDPTNDDTNANGTPNYLDATSTESIENN
ncbi:hypothetical protein ES676_14165 [Bizionia saleffrena]|uniref:peptidylprolyl isomerase n=1 Tax=Bizionia saleffrena TaxID=291189 RepID=A0A8H2LCP5_9FLAO|nr:FKBP-type peptidyl-prolyl cis-trans isomerase [Bizionia saleffrena]TYB69441.1 hypothetical protein ES676_14165 [Bizionia saleffrena]